MINFFEYVDRKQKDGIKELSIIKRILKQGGFQVASQLHTKHDDPYLFVYNPDDSPNFGLRIYKLGGKDIYYRPQKKEKTHPWGGAEQLPIQDIFEDVTSDEEDDDKAAEKIIKSVCEEISQYFKKNAKAEKNLRTPDKSPLGSAMIRGSAEITDFSNTVSPNIRG